MNEKEEQLGLLLAVFTPEHLEHLKKIRNEVKDLKHIDGIQDMFYANLMKYCKGKKIKYGEIELALTNILLSYLFKTGKVFKITNDSMT